MDDIKDDSKIVQCPDCMGLGGWMETVGQDEYGDAIGEQYICPKCEGSGEISLE